LLRDLRAGNDAELSRIIGLISAAKADVLLLTGMDYDHDLLALAALAALVDPPYPYYFAARPNTGIPTGIDIDGDGRVDGRRDAQGYGAFNGQGGMAILSRLPVHGAELRDFSALLWRDLPQTASDDPPALAQVQRLSHGGHWIVPVGDNLTLMAYAATPPAFGARNARRNRDELRLWEQVLAGDHGGVPPGFVILGKPNLDPSAGEGVRQAMVDFLANPLLQDPLPGRATAAYGGDIGDLRVSYVVPSLHWQVLDAGILGLDGLRHALVWVDIAPPDPG
jgi:hypothetical protein